MRLAALGLFVGVALGAAQNFNELAAQAGAALQSNPSEAAELYQRALALKPSWAEGWFYLGTSFYQLRRYNEAKRALERAVGLAPEKGVTWAFLGLAKYQVGKESSALADFEKAEGIGLPDNRQFVSSIHNCAAMVYLRRRDFSQAVAQLQPLAKIGDHSALTVEMLGIAVLNLPYVPANLPPAKQELVQLAGGAEWQMAAEHDAAREFAKLLSAYKDEPGVHYLHGLYLLDHDPQGARAEFQRELQIQPRYAPARLQIGILDIRGGDPAEAISMAQEVLRWEPANALAHTILARAYMDLSDYRKALPELETASKLAPENPELHLYLAQAYRHMSRTAEADREIAEYTRLKAKSIARDAPHAEGTTN
jgi:tetratricopeptide (TPR) repeat protein